MPRKIYTCRMLTHLSTSVTVDGVIVPITFQNAGTSKTKGFYSTVNKKIQDELEKSSGFGMKYYCSFTEEERENIPVVEIPNATIILVGADKPKDNVDADDKTPKITVVDSVKDINDAKEYLIAEFAVNQIVVCTKEKAIKFAEKKGVVFPNFK